jgi:hypothetical protein
MYSRRAVQRLFKALVLNGSSIQVESIYLASRFDYRIAEVPVGWVKTNRPNQQSVRKFSRVLADLAVARLNDRNNRYKEG